MTEMERLTVVSADATLEVRFDLPDDVVLSVERVNFGSRDEGSHVLRLRVIGPTTEIVRERVAAARALILEALA